MKLMLWLAVALFITSCISLIITRGVVGHATMAAGLAIVTAHLAMKS